MWISNAYWVVFSFSQLQSNKLAQITHPNKNALCAMQVLPRWNSRRRRRSPKPSRSALDSNDQNGNGAEENMIYLIYLIYIYMYKYRFGMRAFYQMQKKTSGCHRPSSTIMANSKTGLTCCVGWILWNARMPSLEFQWPRRICCFHNKDSWTVYVEFFMIWLQWAISAQVFRIATLDMCSFIAQTLGFLGWRPLWVSPTPRYLCSARKYLRSRS